MRGKHSNAAANRRDRTELEQRAERAEQRADQAEKELAQLRDASQRQISSLRDDVAKAVKDRDNTVAPSLAQAEYTINQLIAERNDARAHADKMKKRWGKAYTRMKAPLISAGMGETEIAELFILAMDGEPKTITAGIQSHHKQGKEEIKKIRAIQSARGIRGSAARDRLADPDNDDTTGPATHTGNSGHQDGTR